jgi:MFS family permease
VERKWWTLLASCIAIFMLLLDVTIVNVALPSIERDLGANFSATAPSCTNDPSPIEMTRS